MLLRFNERFINDDTISQVHCNVTVTVRDEEENEREVPNCVAVYLKNGDVLYWHGKQAEAIREKLGVIVQPEGSADFAHEQDVDEATEASDEQSEAEDNGSVSRISVSV